MIRTQASLWSNLRRRARPKSSPSTRRRPTSFLARLEWLEQMTLLSNFPVITTADSGAGSLRSAIIASNAATGQTNTISFNIPGKGVQKIALLSALPTITNPVVIDATLINGYTTTPLIELDGTNAKAGTNGLVIAASATGTMVKGLDIHSFGGDGIDVLANNVVLSANFVGTGPSGLTAAPNYGSGIVVRGSNNTIGGFNVLNPDGSFQVMGGNLVSGNAGNGVVIAGAGNVVEGNWIGVDATGKSALGNSLDGVVVDGVSLNTIGGTTAGTRNVISGNLGQGVSIANVFPAFSPRRHLGGPTHAHRGRHRRRVQPLELRDQFPGVELYNIGPVRQRIPQQRRRPRLEFYGCRLQIPDGHRRPGRNRGAQGIRIPPDTGDMAQIGSHIYMATGSPTGDVSKSTVPAK